jgi:hypothetical protein
MFEFLFILGEGRIDMHRIIDTIKEIKMKGRTNFNFL